MQTGVLPIMQNFVGVKT